MPVDLNSPEAVRQHILNRQPEEVRRRLEALENMSPEEKERRVAHMRATMPPGPPPGWYPGHPDDPMSYPGFLSPENQHLVRRVGDPWPEGVPGGPGPVPTSTPSVTPSGTAHSQAGSRPGSSHSHRRSSSVASGATSRSGYSSSSRPGSSHSSAGGYRQTFNAGINALNAAHSQSGRNSPHSYAGTEASMASINSTASALAAMNLNERPTSARGGAYMNPGMPSPTSVAPSAAHSAASSQYSSRSSRAGSIAPSMLRGPESDAGSVWSGGGSSVAPSDSQSSYGTSSRHQRPIRPGVPHHANSSPGGRHSTAGSVASGASYASRNSGASHASRQSGATSASRDSGAKSASRDSGRSGRSSRSGRSHSTSGSVSTGYQSSHTGMSSSTQGSSRSTASSGTIRPPSSVASRTTRGRRSSIESTATQNAGPDGNVFWPELRPNLSSDAALHNFTVVCPVCATSMRADETTSRNIGKILHCGHMLCMECVVRICANVDGSRDNPNARKPECPLCKEPLGRYPNCSKTCDSPGRIGYRMPRNMEEMRRLPLTMPEGGANPSCCKACRIKNIEVQSKKLMRIILNDRKATARWTPAVDPDNDHHGGYKTVPELQNFLDVLADTVRDPEISRKYANLYPQVFSPPQHAVAERMDRTREAS